MPGSNQVNALETNIKQFQQHNQANQQSLQALLKDYNQLLESYKALKKSYEFQVGGVKNADDGDGSRNPYVLVLIDGNGYIFNDELVKDKEEGGMRAARMLNEEIKEYLRQSLPSSKHDRVIVRIYADITGISKLLAKTKLIGLEKRSLAAFTAGFTRAINLFDFVDALDEEGTRFKIREMFKVGAEDEACSHIIFAGCHDTSYLPQLVPFSGLRNKITLLQGAGFSSEFHQFSLNVHQFPTVFRWSGLPASTPAVKPPTNGQAPPSKLAKTGRENAYSPSPLRTESRWNNSISSTQFYDSESAFGGADQSSSATGSAFPDPNSALAWRSKTETPQLSSASKVSTAPCKYHQKGFCRFGAKCNFAHLPKNGKEVTIDRSAISSQLPVSIVSGFIHLNAAGQRLDTYIKPPTQDEWMLYNERFHRMKPCNVYQLQGNCPTFDCPFDHSPLDPSVRRTLEYVVKCAACPRKSACRVENCVLGHLCQKDGCVGQNKGCRMKADMHNVDPKLASMVPSEDDETHDGGADIYGDDGEGYGEADLGGW